MNQIPAYTALSEVVSPARIDILVAVAVGLPEIHPERAHQRFVAYFVVLLLLQLRALSHGPEAYAAFQAWLKAPHVIALNGVSLLFVLFHTITWFNLAPRAMVVRVRGKRLPDLVIAGSNYVAWLVVSVAMAWLILKG
jgi:fumarate reductase subunit C